MKKFLAKLFFRMSGWTLDINKEDIHKKSVVVVAPHTSFYDGYIGFLAMILLDVKYRVISAEWLFFWPFKYIMTGLLNAMPVGKSSANAIRKTVDEFSKTDEMNLVICPEGHLRAVDNWSAGFLMIAKKAKVPIDIIILDYKHKSIKYAKSFHVWQYRDFKKDFFMQELAEVYSQDVYARYPDKFKVPKA